MKNELSIQANYITTCFLIILAASLLAMTVFAHDGHNQHYDGDNDVYLTTYHQHTTDDKMHRHAIDNSLPTGTVHNEIELWNGHEHKEVNSDWITCNLKINYVTGENHTHDGRSHKHVVLYARKSDTKIASLILEKLDLQDIEHSGEGNVYTLQYTGQLIMGNSGIVHTHEWEHKHGDFGWHPHSVEHTHIYVVNEHPDWFVNDENNSEYPSGLFLNGHDVLHSSENHQTNEKVHSTHNPLTLRWASLKKR